MEKRRLKTRVRWLRGGVVLIWIWGALAVAEPKLNESSTPNAIGQRAWTPSGAEICPRRYLSLDPTVPVCPTTQGLTLLPAHYPPRTLLVGYDPEPRYLKFLDLLVLSNADRQEPLHIMVLIPRHNVEQAYERLKSFMQHPGTASLTFLSTPSDESLWPQDYLEVGLSMPDGEAKILDLPWRSQALLPFTGL